MPYHRKPLIELLHRLQNFTSFTNRRVYMIGETNTYQFLGSTICIVPIIPTTVGFAPATQEVPLFQVAPRVLALSSTSLLFCPPAYLVSLLEITFLTGVFFEPTPFSVASPTVLPLARQRSLLDKFLSFRQY